MALGRQDEIPALKAHRAVLGPDKEHRHTRERATVFWGRPTWKTSWERFLGKAGAKPDHVMSNRRD